jgi:exopolysaccharide biosynthesis predicted pyruvyltransferase EpsI
MAEEELIKSLNLEIKFRLTQYDMSERNKKKLILNSVDSKYTILMHGGGRLGDWDSLYVCKRNNIIDWFPNNQIIFFPETIYYSNSNNTIKDNRFYSSHSKLVISIKSEESYIFAQKNFKKTNLVYLPDLTYVIGNMEPLSEPIYDIIVIRNKYRESIYPFTVWLDAFNEFLRFGYSFRDVDWIRYNNIRANPNDLVGSVQRRTNLANKVISLGKVIITDRLQISILCILLGKPHILVDDLTNKMIKMRDFAFYDKSECQPNYLGSFNSNDPRDAVLKAIQILNNYEYFAL